MSTTVTLPDGFQYIGAAFVSTVFLLLGQNSVVGRYRKRAKIGYPQMYAEKAEADASKDALLFNCAQRAHQNTLENIPMIYTLTLVTGTRFPIIAASALGFWSLSRASYTRGYITGDPKKRATVLYLAGQAVSLGLLLTSAYIAGGWLYEGLASKFL
ncbi:hypothetical protein BDZ97DRAFT_380986 [Flammula alnicola]|nr:hypothetical protein BDZ97DRAFT_380986 [Flammula alnicola]